MAVCREHQKEIEDLEIPTAERANPSFPGPVIPTLTPDDTSLFPCDYMSSITAYSSPWIDLCSDNPLISNLSRQILNMEVAYANFCGVRSVIVPGPRLDDGKKVAQYARAIQEALQTASRVSLIIHMPMYREPGLDEEMDTMSGPPAVSPEPSKEIDIFSTWDTWHTIRTVCEYNTRVFVGKCEFNSLIILLVGWMAVLRSYVGLRIPKRLPEMELQTRWFAEPLHYLTIDKDSFQANRAGYPSLSKHHQDMINMYMRLKNAPFFILQDCGPDATELANMADQHDLADFPTLADAHNGELLTEQKSRANPFVDYLRYIERQQEPLTALEATTLTHFQDWLQSPLQPLSDNLESSTYEMFEGDPVKYDLYEQAVTEAMTEWKLLNKPTSSVGEDNKDLVVAVAGAGRGPLVTRVLLAAEKTGTPIQLWAVEKNQNAYVYLLRQNKLVWDSKVHVVKSDMRAWDGPIPDGHPGRTTSVDILVTELLGSFGDNELSPECLDGIQRHIARPHGISIPHSYTAHLSPISTPRLYSDIASRVVGDPNAFETPWVVRLYALDFVSQKVPGRDRFQQAWEFVHPVRLPFVELWEAGHGNKKLQRGGAGSMNLSAGLNEHNARQCHLTFSCMPQGVIHGLAGYFESILYRSQIEGKENETVELSILPEQIDLKSKDMISWFPIFFPLKASPSIFPCPRYQ